MSEAIEIQQIVEHLQGVLENLITRGLRSAGQGERNALSTLETEFTRVGATHLAQRVLELKDAIEADHRDGPFRLLQLQASLRVFERILTLEVAKEALLTWQSNQSEEGADESEPQ